MWPIKPSRLHGSQDPFELFAQAQHLVCFFKKPYKTAHLLSFIGRGDKISQSHKSAPPAMATKTACMESVPNDEAMILLQSRIHGLTEQLTAVGFLVHKERTQVLAYQKQCSELQAEVNRLSAVIADLYASRSWGITSVFRFMGKAGRATFRGIHSGYRRLKQKNKLLRVLLQR